MGTLATMSPGPQSVRAGRLGLRGRLAILAAFLAFVPFAALLLLVVVANRPLLGLDHRVELDVHGVALRHPGCTAAMRTVSSIATPVAWWVVMVPLAAGLLAMRRFRAAAFVPVTFLAGVGLNRLLKTLVARPRPVLPHPVAHAGGFSFPSGHAQAAAVGCGIVLVLVLPALSGAWRAGAAALAALVAGAVSFSRIALGVHFLSDVVGGLLIGAALVLAMTAAFGVVADPGDDEGGTATAVPPGREL